MEIRDRGHILRGLQPGLWNAGSTIKVLKICGYRLQVQYLAGWKQYRGALHGHKESACGSTQRERVEAHVPRMRNSPAPARTDPKSSGMQEQHK